MAGAGECLLQLLSWFAPLPVVASETGLWFGKWSQKPWEGVGRLTGKGPEYETVHHRAGTGGRQRISSTGDTGGYGAGLGATPAQGGPGRGSHRLPVPPSLRACCARSELRGPEMSF